MDKVSRLNQTDRSELFHETAARMNIPEAIIEKDFWVCWVLRYLFNESSLAKNIIFKGGTSLSKVYKIIERFSEDIDLILNWELLGISKEEPWLDRSKTKQDKYNKNVNQMAQDYITETITDILKKDFQAFGIGDLTADVDQEDSFVINVTYPKTFENSYIRPEIRLEIGPLASWVPHESHSIIPYAAELFGDIFENPACKVIAINAERSFWEKATILHQEAHRNPDRMPLLRYSRHYYDLYKMAQHSVKDSALASFNLLEDVVNFKIKFYPCAWAQYETAQPGSLRLLPNKENIKRLKNDYSAMREMIFGTTPKFDDIIEVLMNLEREINDK